MYLDPTETPRRSRIPDVDAAVGAGDGEEVTSWAERDVADLAPHAERQLGRPDTRAGGVRDGKFLADSERCAVQKRDRRTRRDGQRARIGAEREPAAGGAYATAMQRFAAARVVEVHPATQLSGREGLPVGCERRARDRR